MAKLIDSKSFDDEIKEGLVIVDFFASWCWPCTIFALVFENLQKDMEDKVKFLKIEIEESLDIAKRYDILGIPTIIIFKDGEKQELSSGFMSKDIIKEMLEKHL